MKRNQHLVTNATMTVKESKEATSPPKSHRTTVTANLSPKVRHDMLEGRPHLVVPMVMITEGVHNGSAGPLLYPVDELSKTPEVWNQKPVVVYHPQKDGVHISACDPAVVNTQKVGVIMNTKAEEIDNPKKPGTKMVRLSAEAWIEADRAKAIDDRVLNALEKGQMVEVSTGLFYDPEPKTGEWNGEAYTSVARNYRPDHLAILPDQKGACSIEDGAGLLRNEASFDSTRALLCVALREEYGVDSYCYVEDVFRGFFIYSKGGKLWKQNYTATDTSATLSGEPSEVVRVVQYRSPDGTVVANIERNGSHMKAALITALIAANIFAESDKTFLESKDEAVLKNMHDRFIPAKKEEKVTENQEKTPPAPVALIANSTVPTPPKKEMSVEDYIANAPGGVREMLANGLRAHEGQKKVLITSIMANSRNIFTESQLTGKSVEELQALATLAGATVNHSAPSYAGLADALAPRSPVTNEAPLPLPAWDFSKK